MRAEYFTVSALWLVLLVFYVVELRRSGGGWAWARAHPAIPMLLIAPLFLFLNWDVCWFVLVILAYILELRDHSAGDGFMFSFYLIAFVGVIAAFTMVELENDLPDSSFKGPSDALYWAFGGLLRINTGRSYSPGTEDGRTLALVISVCGVLAASMFTAKLVSWVIGDSKRRETPPAEKPVATAAGDLVDTRTRLVALRADVDHLIAEIDAEGK